MPPSVKSEFKRSPVATVAAVIASVMALVSLLILLWVVPAWAEEVEQRLGYNERADEKHHQSRELHMPYQEKIDRFVTRDEWIARGVSSQRQLDEIKDSMKRQEEKMDRIYEKLTRINEKQ